MSFDVGTESAELWRVRVNVTFHNVVHMIHGLIRTANPYPYTYKFILAGVKNNKTQQIRR